jgi:hypothetical protein
MRILADVFWKKKTLVNSTITNIMLASFDLVITIIMFASFGSAFPHW